MKCVEFLVAGIFSLGGTNIYAPKRCVNALGVTRKTCFNGNYSALASCSHSLSRAPYFIRVTCNFVRRNVGRKKGQIFHEAHEPRQRISFVPKSSVMVGNGRLLWCPNAKVGTTTMYHILKNEFGEVSIQNIDAVPSARYLPGNS